MIASFQYMQQLQTDNYIGRYIWIPSDLNVADGLTKAGLCEPLLAVMYNNMLVIGDGTEISGKRAKKQNRFILDEAARFYLGDRVENKEDN